MEQDYINLCDNHYNVEFDNVKSLGRYPWIGINYSKSDYRVLILGDSHYTVDNKGNYCEKEYNRCKATKDYTREIVRCVINDGCEGKPTWTMYRNLINTFTSYTPEEVKYLWSKVAFYNFIKEPMKQINQVPTNEECKIGWQCFNEVVDILKPDFCLFVGIRSNREIDTINSIGGKYIIEKDKEMCNNSSSHYGEIETKERTKTRFRIIKHTSSYYSPEAWYQYLMNKEVKLMCQLDRNYSK